MPLSADNKDYSIAVNDFKSATINSSIDLKDITQIVFAFEVKGGASINLNGAIANVLFSKQTADYYNIANALEVQAFPNPSNGQFTTSFKADKDALLTLRILDATTGKIISSKNVNAVKGVNTIPVEISQNGLHLYLLSLLGDSVNYQIKKIIVDKK